MQPMNAMEAGQGPEEDSTSMSEVSKLRAQISSLESEREMRVKLEKLLEVQTVQVDLHKELRIKTESLLQVEQQTTSKLRQELDALRMQPGPETETRKKIEERLAEAQQHIKKLEQQIVESAAPETSDRMESQLRVQVEEQEQLIIRLTQQLESQGGTRAVAAPEGDTVRLQMLLQNSDKRLDELSHSMRKTQNDLGEAQSEVDVVKHQNRVLRKEVSERTEEMERQLNTERNLRADVFQLQAKMEQLTKQHQDEARRASEYVHAAAERDEFQRQVAQLEANLAEEQTTSSREREKLQAEADHRVQAKEQIINHQKTTIQSLTTELKEKQEDIDRLMRTGSPPPMTSPLADATSGAARERAGWLPPLSQSSPRSEDVQGQRSIEALHRQIKSKDAKIGKQTERLQTLTEMLEKRDQQLEELSTARRERDVVKQRALELEEILKAQPRATTHAEAERRLIEQEQRARENERRIRELEDGVQREKGEKEAMQRELGGLRGNLAQGASSATALQDENARLSKELQEARRNLDGRTEELRRVRESRPIPPPPEAPRPTTLPALQRRLQKVEEYDTYLARDVAVHLQERENKIESLNSTVSLLRNTVDDLRKQTVSSSGAAVVTTAATLTGSAPISPAAPSSPTRTDLMAASRTETMPPFVGPRASADGTVMGTTRSDQLRSFPLGLDAGQAAPDAAQDRGSFIDQRIDQAAATLTTEDVRQELISRRKEVNNLEQQLNEKQQLVMKLIEEANLCNAEVASLQQTVQQAYKAARKKDREFDKLQDEKDKYEKAAHLAQHMLAEKENKISKMLKEHQEDTSGNAAIDEMERNVGWKLKVIAPRQHEIRHSMFLVLNRRQSEGQSFLDKVVLAQGLAHHFAISVTRIDIVEDARLPDSAVGDGTHRSPSPGSIESFPDTPRRDNRDDNEDMQRFDSPGGHHSPQATKRDLVLVNIADAETGADGQPVRSTISALDVLDQVRNDMLRGRKVGPIGGIEVDAVFINHGDIVLPYEWPSMQGKCLLREGRVLAGKHAVVTVHEVRDPYVLRVVAYDTEVGREFVLFLNTRDVMLLLDTHDSESMQGAADSGDQGPTYVHLEGASASHYRQVFSVSEGPLLEIIVNSLSFSVWQNQQILVASEMRIPSTIQQPSTQGTQSLVALALEGQAAQRSMARTPETAGRTSMNPAREDRVQPLDEGRPQQPPTLPEVGPTRGLLPLKRETRRLFEDVIGFEGRLCVFSLVHTSTQDLNEDMLRCSVYYPRTCAHVEACLNQPMLSDRLRVVAEAGQLDPDGPLSVVIVVEETIYPPSFLIRLTSVCLDDAYLTSPKEEVKPHSHVIRVAKDGSSALHLPDISFAVSPSTMRDKMLRCIGLSTPVQGPRETQLTMPSTLAVTGQSAASQPSNAIMKRTVTGHVSAPYGLKVQLINSSNRHLAESDGTDPIKMAMPAAVRAQLRAKYGKGRLLVRHGRMLNLRGKNDNKDMQAIRAVVSIYERPQPYQHFVMCAYEPQTSREWETLADSIDIFRLFTDNKERQETIPQALDLATPATQEKLAEVLVNCIELAERNDEFVLIVPPDTIREYVEKSKLKALEAGASLEDSSTSQPEHIRTGSIKDRHIEPFEVKPAVSRVNTRALLDGEDPLEQKTGDRLFTAQRRLAPAGRGPPDPYKIQIYDAPLVTTLHNYVVVATPIHANALAAAGLPAAILAAATSRTGTAVSAPEVKPHHKMYTLRLDDKMLHEFITDQKILEPSHQEQLLHAIFKLLHLVEDGASGNLKMTLRKVSQVGARAIKDDPDALAEMLETYHAAPGMMPDGNIREIGGSYPLNRLRIGSHKETPAGPSLAGGGDYETVGRMFSREWKKVFCMAQRFGTSTVMITVKKMHLTYKLSVYEPESSALYEMSLVTSSSSTPLNVLIERCDLAGKLDLVMCMHEVSFPHQLAVNLLHLATNQEFNLKIGDDFVYAMTENSRREAFTIYLDQLLHWGCIGFDAAPGTEDQVLANVYEETFSGNQIFERTPQEDVLNQHLNATIDGGELRVPTALAPQPPKKIRVPVIRTQLDFLGKRVDKVAGISMHLVYHAEYNFPVVAGQQQTLLMRIHKRVTNNDIAVTLRVRTADCELSLPPAPDVPAASSANGRPFETPALGAGESRSAAASEITLWLNDKCSRAPCGAYGELCEVPGIDKSMLLLITDEDSPRAIRLAVTLATLPFTVLFQVVLLEASEPTAKVDTSSSSSNKNASRKVLQQTFLKYFGLNRAPTSAVLSHMTSNASQQRDQDLRKKLDDLSATEGPMEHLGLEHGTGAGEPRSAARGDEPENDSVQVSIVHMCTRQKLGRMMVFTIYRDMISQNMYLRVVMHDPVSGKEQHLTLLHYTTQRLLNILRINRDMIEESYTNMSDDDKRERSQLRAELGKLIVDHLYLKRVGDPEGFGEELDNQEFPDEEEVEYELRMRDIMNTANSSDLTIKQHALETAHKLFPETSRALHQIGSSTPTVPLTMHPAQAATQSGPKGISVPQPKTLLEMTEDHLLHKAEKVVNGRRVLVAFYNETSRFDNVHYSHNIRIVVACIQSLAVLAVQDFHEDTLELLCARRGKRHLMSATSEKELVAELCDILALQHLGQKITGITFAGMDE